MMKRMIMAMLAGLMVTACLCVAHGETGAADEYRAEIEMAMGAIADAWSADDMGAGAAPYLEIKNTRIIFIKESAGGAFEGYHYVVEFILFSNYYGSAPYYDNVGLKDSVVVYSDGRIEVQSRNPFSTYRAKMFVTDFSDIIEKLIDLGAAYNQVL